jgi:hypothetical protein
MMTFSLVVQSQPLNAMCGNLDRGDFLSANSVCGGNAKLIGNISTKVGPQWTFTGPRNKKNINRKKEDKVTQYIIHFRD